MNNMPHDYVEACDWVEEMRAELARLKADRDALLDASRALLDMITNNRLHGPETEAACAAIAQAEKELEP